MLSTKLCYTDIMSEVQHLTFSEVVVLLDLLSILNLVPLKLQLLQGLGSCSILVVIDIIDIL